MGIKKMIARYIASRRQGVCSTCENGEHCRPARQSPAHEFARDGHAPARRRKKYRIRRERIRRYFARLSKSERGLAHQVEKALLPLLSSNEATAERVAEHLGWSRQTLYRKLNEESTSFTEVRAATRRRLAIDYLRVDKAPVKVVAWRLGFSSPEAFSRAFKRWTGSTPARFQSSQG